MYNLTGLPGWVRFGFSPGWGGLPPCAQYLQQTGQLEQAVDWFQRGTGSQPVSSYGQASVSPAPQFGPATEIPRENKEQEVQMLIDQVNSIEGQLKRIKERINQLKE